MPTKNEIKTIRSLNLKKNRKEHGLFVAEGEKLISHFIKLGLKARHLFSTNVEQRVFGFELVNNADMKRMSFLNSPSSCFAVFEIPKHPPLKIDLPLILVLDALRDPGNMGTILRLCDWFGVHQIICTDDCVDVFNEKVVQASMGSVAVTAAFCKTREEIASFLKENNFTVYGADMNANSVYETNYQTKSALILGNEGQGISVELDGIISERITIPAAQNAKAESLNVATAAAILLSDYSRKAN